jgi:hypothetical protein
MRKLALAAVLAAGAVTPALAQSITIQAPPNTYYPYPPANDWQQRHGEWRSYNEARRHEYYDEWRQANWRCEHGDGAACGWIRAH